MKTKTLVAGGCELEDRMESRAVFHYLHLRLSECERDRQVAFVLSCGKFERILASQTKLYIARRRRRRERTITMILYANKEY